MKQIVLYSFIGCLLLAGCDLEEDPETFFSPSNFYQNEEDVKASIYGIYDARQENIVEYFYLTEAPSPEVIVDGVSNDLIDQFDWDGDTDAIYKVWLTYYTGINRANSIITRIPDVPNLNETKQNRYMAEARFLRAMFYFDLIRLFGNVPLLEKETKSLADLYPDNINTAQGVWQLIINDLTFAETFLPESRTEEERGRATKWAAKGLLAKVYLQRSGLATFNPVPQKWAVAGINEWQLALTKTQEIIESAQFDLLVDYESVFNVEYNKERLFEIQYIASNGEGHALTRNTMPDGALEGQGFGVSRLSPQFLEEWTDTTDNRFKKTFLIEYKSVFNDDTIRYPGQLEHPYCAKYRIQDGIGEENGANIMLMRYADVLLMQSEASNESGLGDPYLGINEVRRRAGEPLLSNLSQDSLRFYIRKERRFELIFEFNRYFDMQRWGTLISGAKAGGYHAENYQYIYPIPSQELNINPNLVQNDNY